MRVILIEDNEDDVRLIQEMLARTSEPVELECADRLSTGLERLAACDTDVVLLDLGLPDSKGFDTLARVNRRAPGVPVVVLTGIEDETLALQALQAGAQDYLVKGQVDSNLLVRSIRYAMERKRAEEQIRDLAYEDQLTGLPNRRLFLDRLELALSQARRTRQHIGVLLLDLDGFKVVNDTLGHGKGDLLLQRVVERLKLCVRSGDTLARLGGDEFTILLPELARVDDTAKVAQKLLDAFAQPFLLEGRELPITTSLGISLYPVDGTDGDTLLKNADSAMYRAKKEGGNAYQLCNPAAKATADERLALERSLRNALDRQEFFVHYQPLVDLPTGQIFGAEALVRWHSPEQGLVSPAGFIAVAEQTGLIVPLGLWVLRAACTQTKAWHLQGYPHLRIAVNLSARQLRQGDLVSQFTRVMNDTGLGPEWLEVEITELMVMHDADIAITTLHALSMLGVRLSMDDFGTGYFSLSSLKQIPHNTLKIDASFIRGIGTDSGDAAVVSAVITLAHSLGLKVIAEGVETREQLEFLRAHQCEGMQGYLFSPPVPAELFEQFLEQDKRLAANGKAETAARTS